MRKGKFVPVFMLLALLLSVGIGAAMSEESPSIQNALQATVTPQPEGADLQPGVWEFIADNYLSHAAEFPDPSEPVELLRVYLDGQGMLRAGKVDEAVTLFKSAVANYPDSRHAHAGLGYALWQRYQQSQAEDDLRFAMTEFIVADEIGMKYGRVHYTHPVAIGLGQLKDSTAMNSYFEKALKQGNEPYLGSLDYARGLSLLEDPRAEEWYKKAIRLQPKGNVDALAYYAEWLLDKGREAEVLTIIRPEEHIQYLHFLRGVGLERLGRIGEARVEYLQYVEYSASDPAPSRYRIPGSRVQEGIVFDDQIGPLGIGCYGYELLANVIECEASTESEGGRRAVGWTVRTRVFKGTLPNCVDVNNYSCGDFLSCEYECVITQADQFVYSCGKIPGTTSTHVRYDVYNGYAPDPTTGYCPSGSYQGDACSSSVHCSSGGANGASSKGPMRFYSTTGTCTTGWPYSCLTSKGKVCGNGWYDHCFYNRP